MLNVCLRVRVKWLQFSCCVSRLTVCPYVLHLLMSITPANQGHINQQWCQEAWGRESARPLLLSITLAVNCHLASNIDFFFFFFTTQTDWPERFYTNGISQFVSIMGCETRLDTLSVFLPLSLCPSQVKWRIGFR